MGTVSNPFDRETGIVFLDPDLVNCIYSHGRPLSTGIHVFVVVSSISGLVTSCRRNYSLWRIQVGWLSSTDDTLQYVLVNRSPKSAQEQYKRITEGRDMESDVQPQTNTFANHLVGIVKTG